jgi:hypothetical protein
MNKFIKGFKNTDMDRYQREERVISFSERLNDILGVSDGMLKMMADECYSMDIGKIKLHPNKLISVTLQVTKRCFTDGWVNVIEAEPTYARMVDGDWSYGGDDDTESILPSDEAQKLILELVKTLI